VLIAALLAPLPSCYHTSEVSLDDQPGDTDIDTDGDSDSDSDTDDTDADTDGDTGTDPAGDEDGDWLSNGFEEEFGTDPDDEDTDDDGYSDLVEWIAGTDPNDPDSNPSAEGNFYFLVPYGDVPDPPDDILEFSTSIEKADLFFLVDTTGSMGGEITNLKDGLSTYIIPEVEAIIDDVWFAVGGFDDYPVDPYGSATSSDLPFYLLTRTTPFPGVAQAAVNDLDTHYGADGAESHVPALWATATGEGLGTYLAPQESCDADEIGYPCFRDGAIPIVMLITDAAFHNGPADSEPYNGITPVPPTYLEAVEALNALHARVLPIWSLGGYGDVEGNCSQIAYDTGAVDTFDDPLVFNINSAGTGLDEEVVNAVDALAHEVPIDISAVGRDDETDSVDAMVFIEHIAPFNEDTAECTGGLVTADTDDDDIDDTFIDVLPGAPVCFEIVPQDNAAVPSIEEPQVFMAYIDVFGDSVTILDTREVYFVVPPDSPME
jgi:hypothetical protein